LQDKQGGRDLYDFAAGGKFLVYALSAPIKHSAVLPLARQHPRRLLLGMIVAS
jgi:hypothetical protein